MKMSYYLGLGGIVLLAIVAGLVLGPAYYLNLPSILIVSGTCFGALVCNFGLKGSFSALGALALPDRKTAAGFRKSAAKTVMLSGLFAGLFYLIMGVIAALGSIGDLARIGPSLATGFLSLLYGSFIALLMVPAYVSEE
ncbi:MAG: MotA/TolQ/ExbB proton channel family protein [Desulfobacterales bacterium]|nr:MotA/TolQ/ExbB proton channel family protein [Desulfobacterales bacterium]